MAPTFSAKSLGQFEQFIQANLRHFLQQLTQLSELQGSSNSGYASIDALNWFSYLAFDIIGDFVFSAPFGMLPRGQDVAEMKKSPDAPPSYVPAVRVRNRRGELSATLACIPAILPFAKYLPFRVFREGLEAMDSMAGIAIARVAERLRPEVMANNKRVDFLSHLIEGCDENGAKFGREEITAEALTQISAGSDTTSNTLCMILYWVLKTPGVTEKLQEVLDEAIPTHIDVPSFAMAKDIP